MYHQFFGLHEPPFSITPNPRFVFLSHRHEDALAHLNWGITQGGGGGFVQLTGEVGTGKTTLCRLLLEQLPEDCRAALILNPKLNPLELLQAICDELKIRTRGAMTSQKKLVDRLNKYLLNAHAEGLTVVVIIDEAQNLTPESLEQVRLLTNLETDTQKLLQIILLGQPELRNLLSRPDLRQLSQRITARFHLDALDETETADYVDHRLAVAGCQHSPFDRSALKQLYRVSSGVPRLINIMAERALLIAYAESSHSITRRTVARAAREIQGPALNESPRQTSADRGTAKTVLVTTTVIVLLFSLAVLAWNGGYVQQWLNSDDTSMANLDSASPSIDATAEVVSPDPFGSQGFADSLSLLREDQRLPEFSDISPGQCNQRLLRQLFCQTGHATSDAMAALNRPVIAECPRLEQGYVVARFTETGVELIRQDGREELTRAEFEKQWSGRYWDYWQVPAYLPDILEETARGPAVIWVKQAAKSAEPAYAGDAEDPYFGPSLKQWAISFQNSHGIRPDGVIGRDTLQYLKRYSTAGY